MSRKIKLKTALIKMRWNARFHMNKHSTITHKQKESKVRENVVKQSIKHLLFSDEVRNE